MVIAEDPFKQIRMCRLAPQVILNGLFFEKIEKFNHPSFDLCRVSCFPPRRYRRQASLPKLQGGSEWVAFPLIKQFVTALKPMLKIHIPPDIEIEQWGIYLTQVATICCGFAPLATAL